MALFLLVTRAGLTGNQSKTAVFLGFELIQCASGAPGWDLRFLPTTRCENHSPQLGYPSSLITTDSVDVNKLSHPPG
jgi:hypothetical protein